MNIKTKMVFTYKNKKYAEIAYNALYPDNADYLDSYVEDNKLICFIENDKIGTVLNTIEDLIQCEKMIEKTSEFVK